MIGIAYIKCFQTFVWIFQTVEQWHIPPPHSVNHLSALCDINTRALINGIEMWHLPLANVPESHGFPVAAGRRVMFEYRRAERCQPKPQGLNTHTASILAYKCTCKRTHRLTNTGSHTQAHKHRLTHTGSHTHPSWSPWSVLLQHTPAARSTALEPCLTLNHAHGWEDEWLKRADAIHLREHGYGAELQAFQESRARATHRNKKNGTGMKSVQVRSFTAPTVPFLSLSDSNLKRTRVKWFKPLLYKTNKSSFTSLTPGQFQVRVCSCRHCISAWGGKDIVY